ncbi:MAG: hypothetical protein E6K70_26205 [Planctomycetota bacterium]|nr:MAG: hypothetical protein E6K70_26205 [Planctomycetota bacterium]
MLLGLVLEILLPTEAADLRSKAAREAAEYVLKKFGKEVAEESAESLARKIEVYTAKHGEEFLEAVRKVGPRAFHLAEEAGVHGNQAVKLMARFGDDATVWVLSRPQAAAMFARYGEDAAEALIKHKGIAEPVVEAFGRPAIGALKTVNAQNGRRLAMMLEEGQLAAMGRSPELLDVVAKHGDRAMEFIWRHKGALVVSAGLTAFLANPHCGRSGREARGRGSRKSGARGCSGHELDAGGNRGALLGDGLRRPEIVPEAARWRQPCSGTGWAAP